MFWNVRYWLPALLAISPATVHATPFWFEECGTAVEFRATVDRVKPDGRPWDTPLSAPMLRSSAPDIAFCTKYGCTSPCVDSYVCSASLRDPPDTVLVLDRDIINDDAIGLCKSLNGTWTCAAKGTSSVKAHATQGTSCTLEFDRRLRRAENDGCQVQAIIWARAETFRVLDRIVRDRVSRNYRGLINSLGEPLRALVKKGDDVTKPRDVGLTLEIEALQLASKPSWLPEDWLRFSLILSAASVDEDAQDGLFPFTHREVLRACSSLYL